MQNAWTASFYEPYVAIEEKRNFLTDYSHQDIYTATKQVVKLFCSDIFSSNNQRVTQDTDVHITHNPLADWPETGNGAECSPELYTLENGDEAVTEEPQEETKLTSQENRKNSSGLG